MITKIVADGQTDAQAAKHHLAAKNGRRHGGLMTNLKLSLILFCLLFLPMPIHAGKFYNCLDQNGKETLSDYPLAGHTCRQIWTDDEDGRPLEDKKAESQVMPKVTFLSDKITNIVMKGNSVLVPVTLVHDSNVVDVNLLLDTGASGTTINEEIADQLAINLNSATKIQGRVVGGGVIEAGMTRINSITFGPYTFHNWNIYIVPHEGVAAKYDGLLGMDVLRELKYKIDFKQKVIIWE